MEDSELSWMVLLLLMVLPEEKIIEAFERAKPKCEETLGVKNI